MLVHVNSLESICWLVLQSDTSSLQLLCIIGTQHWVGSGASGNALSACCEQVHAAKRFVARQAF